jgi:hypothetical protein
MCTRGLRQAVHLESSEKRRSKMKSTLTFVAMASTAAPVLAQEVQAVPRPAPTSVERALEITLGAGYAQGFGDVGASQRSLTDLSSAGGELSLGVGYRIDRHFLVGVYGSGSQYSTGDFTGGADVWSATAGLQGGTPSVRLASVQ